MPPSEIYKSIYDYLHKISTNEIEASGLTYTIYEDFMPSNVKQGIIIAKVGGDTVEKVYITGDKLLNFKFILRSSQESLNGNNDETKVKLSDFLDHLASVITTKFNSGEYPILNDTSTSSHLHSIRNTDTTQTCRYTPKSIKAITSSSLATHSVDTFVYTIDINFKYEEKNIK